jgi:hypothetical protein
MSTNSAALAEKGIQKMPVYRAKEPNTEIIGASILGAVQCMNKDHVLPILEAHGLTNIEPGTWYPLDSWLAALTDMSERGNAMFDFVAIGVKVVETAVLPPQYAALPYEHRMMSLNTAYQAQYRNGNVGELIVEREGEKHFKVTDTGPAPSDLLYGSLWAQARRGLPEGTDFTVRYDELAPRKEEGGDATIIHVTWK